MISRISRANSVILSGLVLICGLGLTAQTHAQTQTQAPTTKKAKKAKAKKADAAPADTTAETPAPSLVKSGASDEEVSTQGEILKFNTDSKPVSSDRHDTMKFKDSGEAPLGTPRKEYADAAPEDSGYKAYIGYPKHQLGIYAAPTSVSSKWTSVEGYQYNFSSSATGLGLNYKLMISPMWTTEVDYQHYSLALDAAKVKLGSLTFTFQDSTANFDNYYIRNKFCLIGKSTFFQQLCPGVDIGNDGYPIVNYNGGNSTLALSRVQDLVLGVNITYQIPAGQTLLFRIMAGYNMGTGIGNSGALTSKQNSSYFGDADLDWNVTEHNVITVGANYKARTAKVSGTDGVSQISWQTDSSTLGGRIGYARQF